MKRQALNTRSWPLPEEVGAWESGTLPIGKAVADPATTPEPSRPQTLLDGAVDLYLLSKNKRAKDTQRKTRNLVARLRQFCSTYDPVITTVQECNDFEALTRFVASWTDANTTQNNNRTELIAFFSFCVKAKYITENAASGLATIPNTTPQTDVFTHEELIDIYVAASHLADEYGRGGTSIAKQTKAFALVLRYTGLSIGDVTGLPKSHVHGDRIVTNRDKTGKEVYVRVPSVVLEALRDAPHDSDQYFFWSGNGEIRTRTSKWGDRLQRLFVLARVRLKEVDHWPKRATKSRKARKNAETSKRTISQADPRWFRHTLARDLLENQIVTMEELSEILANSLAVCDKHYSKWDRRRQTRIDDKLEQFWGTDPILNRR